MMKELIPIAILNLDMNFLYTFDLVMFEVGISVETVLWKLE